MGGFAADGAALYPWMNQAEITQGGFRDQMINGNITSIRDSIGDISTQLCNGFAGIEAGANARQMADMNRSFALQSQLADCLKKIVKKAKDSLEFTRFTVGSCAA